MTSYTSEKIEELRALIKMMREEGVCNFTAGDISVAFDVIPTGPKTIEMTTEDNWTAIEGVIRRITNDPDATWVDVKELL